MKILSKIWSQNYLYFYSFLLFVIDIGVANFYQNYVFSGLLCLLSLALFLPGNQIQLSILLLFITLEQFIIYGHFGLPLLYLLPITILVLKTKHVFRAHKVAPYLILIGFLAIQSFVIDPYMFHHFYSIYYTMGKFIANIIVAFMLSLKF